MFGPYSALIRHNFRPIKVESLDFGQTSQLRLEISLILLSTLENDIFFPYEPTWLLIRPSLGQSGLKVWYLVKILN